KYLNYFDIHINMHSFTVSEVKSFILWFGLAMFWILFFKNSSELRKSFKPSWKYLVLSVVICFLAIISMGKISEFIYFQF
ncbi:hypothetical protein KC571_03665, partial [candidate division WWE3 bacterium]|nr:hypothetical protein [candidate division WWE3 bacterium]